MHVVNKLDITDKYQHRSLPQALSLTKVWITCCENAESDKDFVADLNQTCNGLHLM